MHKVIHNINDDLDALYDAKKMQYVQARLPKYIGIVTKGLAELNERLTYGTKFSNTEGLEVYQDTFIKIYKKLHDILELCMEYANYIQSTKKYSTYEAYDNTLEEYLEKFDKVYSYLKAGLYVGPITPSEDSVLDDTDTDAIIPKSSITKREIIDLIFCVFFGYKPSTTLDLSIINGVSCKFMLQIPALGVLLYPIGYDNSYVWSSNASQWKSQFLEYVGEYSTYFAYVRRWMKRILIRGASASASTPTISVIDKWIDAQTDLSSDLSSDDTEFAQSIYTVLKNASGSMKSLTQTALLLPSLALKGIRTGIPYVPSYFPTYDPTLEVMNAVFMIVNRIITYVCVGGNSDEFSKEYYNFITYDGEYLSESCVNPVDSWEYGVDYREVGSDTTSTHDIEVSTSSTNPTAQYTNPIFGTEDGSSKIWSTKYFTAKNPKLLSLIKTVFSDFSSYNNIMSRYDYMCFDTGTDPTSKDGTLGIIPFRDTINTYIFHAAFETEIDFPIVPYKGTNFINTWLLNSYWKNSDNGKYLPQLILEEGTAKTSSTASSEGTFKNESKFVFTIHALAGDLSGTETVTGVDNLFKLTYAV